VNRISEEQQCAVIAALCDGVSIRATERLTTIHRDTIMRLGLKVGEGCAALHGKLVKNVHVSRLELDEVWSFVGKKRKNVSETDPDTVGDQYIFLAMDAISKGILSWIIGKRSYRNTQHLLDDVQSRVSNVPEISSDGFNPYPKAVALAFDGKAPHGVVDKQTVILAGDGDKAGYYAKEQLVAVKRTAVAGAPTKISTSYVERVNLTMRMAIRRMTRLTNAFSKKYENHCAAVALWAMHYNFCRVHEALRVTPAMHLGLTDHIWTITELVQAALSGGAQAQVKRAKLRIIRGGNA
jgi:IS1 family transposase